MINKPEHNDTIPIKIEYAFISDIAYFSFKKNRITSLIFKNGKDWLNFDNTLLTFDINNKTSISQFGTYPVSEIKFKLGGDNLELSDQISNIKNSKLLFKITFYNKNEKILGTKIKPCFVSFDSNNKTNNEYSFFVKHNDIFRYLDLHELNSSYSIAYSFAYKS